MFTLTPNTDATVSGRTIARRPVPANAYPLRTVRYRRINPGDTRPRNSCAWNANATGTTTPNQCSRLTHTATAEYAPAGAYV
ncbi:MAG: hypothetical protein M3Y49_05865 [Actinomycetota bacterium]|nr:hypothetical protein [Actinomycetota bacterium]